MASFGFLSHKYNMVSIMVFFWCVFGGLCTGFDGDSDGITLGIYDVIELGLSYWDLYGCIYGNIESLVIGFQYFINADVGWCVSGCLGTGFGIDVDLITLGIDEVIELVFLERYFEGFIYGKIGGSCDISPK